MPAEIGDISGRRTSLSVSIVGMVAGAQVVILTSARRQCELNMTALAALNNSHTSSSCS